MRKDLTVDKSAELIMLGVKYERASMLIPMDAPYRTSGIRLAPVFSIGDLFSILPKEIKNSKGHIIRVSIMCHGASWEVKYADVISYEEREFINALFGMIVRLIENGYVNPSEL